MPRYLTPTLVRTMIETVENAAEDQGDGRFILWADDMTRLGSIRLLCDLELEKATDQPT